MAARIARYKKPKHVIFVAALPKTPAGTIDREAVKATWGRKCLTGGNAGGRSA